MGKTKTKAKPKKGRPSHGQRLIEGMEEVLRYFRGEPNGIKVTRVKLTPTILAIRALIDARREAGLSQAEVAAAAGLSASWISRLEHGRVTNPSVENLTRYARAVNREVKLSVESPAAASKSV